jgi:hypothetical protein
VLNLQQLQDGGAVVGDRHVADIVDQHLRDGAGGGIVISAGRIARRAPACAVGTGMRACAARDQARLVEPDRAQAGLQDVGHRQDGRAVLRAHIRPADPFPVDLERRRWCRHPAICELLASAAGTAAIVGESASSRMPLAAMERAEGNEAWLESLWLDQAQMGSETALVGPSCATATLGLRGAFYFRLLQLLQTVRGLLQLGMSRRCNTSGEVCSAR